MELPGEKLLIKLCDVLAEGLGAVARPWLTRRNSRADADAMRTRRLAQEKLRHDLKDVRAGRTQIDSSYRLITGRETGTPAADIICIETNLLEKAERSRLNPRETIELERLINLDQIAALALAEAASSQEAPVNDEPINPDWFTQWRNKAQDVSSEDMQLLWARVLNGQLRSEGTYSIHTLDFLSRMSRSDAELITRIGCYVINGSAIWRGPPFDWSGLPKAMKAAGISLDDILYLGDLGLLSGTGGASSLAASTQAYNMSMGWCAPIRCNDKALLMYLKSVETKSLSIPGYLISVIGRELLSLSECKADIDYLHELADTFRDRCQRIEITSVTGGDPTSFSFRGEAEPF